jgi:hypothetical protein
MIQRNSNERLIEQQVTYTLLKDDKLYVIENVPAHVNVETGEQLFSLQTVERLQKLILGNLPPVQVVETPVFDAPGPRLCCDHPRHGSLRCDFARSIKAC